MVLHDEVRSDREVCERGSGHVCVVAVTTAHTWVEGGRRITSILSPFFLFQREGNTQERMMTIELQDRMERERV